MELSEAPSSSHRSSVLKSAIHTQPRRIEKVLNSQGRAAPVSEYFGSLTFGLAQMREKISKDAYKDLIQTLDHGKKLKPETADAIASVIKDWAVAKGVTHFCHWFQPMTGLTAEKHDAFISIQHAYHSELRVVERFTGSQLIQGEPDASSFPSGGMRSTFEARGYTAWDPGSPLFILEDDAGKTLCIPTVFFGYHGQALDNKTPLLRSIQVLSREACEFLKLLGDVDVKNVQATLGAEQEYFLIDKNFVAMRPDLLMTGRTLLGASPTRGQQLEDHYFGSIPRRVKLFMEDAEHELFKLGIPVKTRHNEVAPSQFEVAPIFEDASVAADHNTLTMEVLKKTALRHGMVCLMHEKPFAGINGSGKHNNWSVSNDKGENLLDPGTTPHQNLRFLAVLGVVLKAVHEHAGILRASIASPGNDHRLGANEAPPAILSVFLGSLLGEILDDIEQGKALQATERQILDLGVSTIPNISRDYTDRNRTSPFAFTGNKFEFRAVGSSANVAVPMSILNGAVANSFKQCSSRLKELLKTKGSRDEAVMELVRQLVSETKKIRFEGNGYSDEWKVEAKKRGLPILSTSAEALQVFKDAKSTQFLSELGILTQEELMSRYHINVERYVKTLEIELNTLVEMSHTMVIPAMEKQINIQSSVRESMKSDSLKKLYDQRAKGLEDTFKGVLERLEELEQMIEDLHKTKSETDKMVALAEKTMPQADKLREAVDQAERIVADEFWPLPKYREMLFANALT